MYLYSDVKILIQHRYLYNKIKKYTNWSKECKTIAEQFSSEVLSLKQQGFKVSAFAASAKDNIFLNNCLMNTDSIDFIVDETPEKISKFSPGTGISIVGKQKLIDNPPDYLVILSWNFTSEIIEKVSKYYSGKFIIGIPEYKVIERNN